MSFLLHLNEDGSWRVGSVMVLPIEAPILGMEVG
jgi:hypothetical protein